MPSGPRTILRRVLGYEGVPLMSRPALRVELLSGLFMTIGLAPSMHQFTQLFARKSLQAAPILLAVLMAGSAAGNLLATFFSHYLQRRRRVSLIVATRLISAAALAAIALMPARSNQAVNYVLLLLVPALMNAVALTIQSSVWHSNFSTAYRGQIFSRLFVIRAAVAILTLKAAGYALDYWPGAHHAIYAVAAAALVIGAILYSRLRVRRERAMLRKGVGQPTRLLAGFGLLARDRAYRHILLWQMVGGGSYHLAMPVVALLLTDVLRVSYSEGATALVLAPMVVMLAAAPLAGRLFDHMVITHFRALTAMLWAVGWLVLCAGIATRSWVMVLVGFGIQGLGSAGTGISFSLGHTPFTSPGNSQVYMGIHLSLQGVRGMTLPFVGIWLYRLTGMGTAIIALAAGLQIIAIIGYLLSPKPRPVASGE